MTIRTAKEITDKLLSLRDDRQRAVLMRFFKTGPGEYGEGDEFLGIKVPTTRQVVRLADKDFPLSETELLLNSPWHEVRLCGLLILVKQYELLSRRTEDEATKRRNDIVAFYLHHADSANNWDLVVNVLFSAIPHHPAVFQPVMWTKQKNDFPSLTYILI